MILTSDKILAEVQFEPALDEFQVNPHSVDLRLAEDMVIAPGKTTRGRSMEAVKMPPDVAATVYPRSSTNRRGLEVHMTGIVDANYAGTLTIPITNHTEEAIKLLKGERVASMVFHRLDGDAKLRLSKYHLGDGSYVADKGEEAAMLAAGDVEGIKRKYSL